MKSLALNLLLLVFTGTILLSCAGDDDGIYFGETNDLTVSAKVSYSDMESAILTLVNEHRKSLNLNELSPLNIISSVASTHTNYMINVGELSHDNFPQRAQELIENTAAKSVGENVAYGFGTAQGVVNGWLNSVEHKKIIENPDYTHFGISTKSNSEGRNYFTQMFIDK